MHRFPRFRGIVCAVLSGVLASATATVPTAAGEPSFRREVKIGVLANRGASQCLDAWGPTAEYLGRHIPGLHFTIVPLGYTDVEPAVAQRQVDFVFLNPAQYVVLEAQYQIGRVATIESKVGGVVTREYGTAIFCRADRQEIRSLKDLRGKSFMSPEETSFGGWLMAMRELRQAGIDLSTDLASVHATGTQDAVVLAVLRGEVDAGAVRTDTLERMAAQGKIRLSDFRIIPAYDGPPSPEFPSLVSTRLYPEWPLAKLPHVPLALTEQVAQQLRNMPETAAAAQKAGIAGWTYPADYGPVRKCLEELGIGPFRPSVTVTLAAIVRACWPWLLAAAVVLAAMIGLIAGFARMNHRLVAAQQQSQRELIERRIVEAYADEAAGRLRKLSRAVEQSPASIVITDRQGAVEYVNPGFVGITGYTVEEALGKNPRVLKSGVHPPEFYGQMWKVLGRKEVWRGEICNRKKNGDLYWEDATIAPVLDAQGTITDFVAVKVDISERKRAEEALRAAKEQAEEANRAKSQFLASMSHELRTPLNGVIGMTELLGNTELDDRQRRFVVACQSSGKSLLALINDILDFSKIEAGKLELDEHDFDLDQLVEETVETLAFQAREKRIRLFSQISPPARLRVHGDSGRVRQLLVNLIGNAIKFTEVGEVAVRVAPLDEPTGQRSIHFAVTDTGIGIPADRLDRLFISFSQADSSTTRKYGGTGLGLAINKSLVQLMGGQIGVESRLGGGSTFWFTLPLKSAEGHHSPNARSAVPVAASRTFSGARVLLAEDNRVNRMFAEEILRQAGIACHAVENGRQALDAVQGEPFDLVLMDCQMPEMDGFDATRHIREMESSGQLAGHTPVIALTANAITGDRERCVEAGMDDYLSKPFEPQSLFEILARFLASNEDARGESPAGEARPTTSPESPTPPIDGDALLARCMGNLELAADLLSDFAGDLDQHVEIIAGHARQGDAQAAAESAHALKGAAGTLGAEALRTLAAKIEATGRGGDLAKAASLVEELRGEAQRCLRYAAALRETMTMARPQEHEHLRRDDDERTGG